MAKQDPRPMGQRKSGLTVPSDAANQCNHAEVFKRIKPQMNQYVCGGCNARLLGIIIQFALMTLEEFEQFKIAQAQQQEAARRKSVGLVTPDEVRRQEGQK